MDKIEGEGEGGGGRWDWLGWGGGMGREYRQLWLNNNKIFLKNPERFYSAKVSNCKWETWQQEQGS